jgi:hypothetical protein
MYEDDEMDILTEEEIPDFFDDVDESHYNPYMGCDEYEYNNVDDGGW